MADTKVSALTQTDAPLTTDEFPINQGSVSKKVTLAQLLTAEPFQVKRLTIAGTLRRTVAGTDRLSILDQSTTEVVVGSPKTTSATWVVPNGWEYVAHNRLTLGLGVGGGRLDLRGSADVFVIDDFGTRSRIVLAGRG